MNIQKVKIYHANVNDIWDAITNEDKLSSWFMKAKFKAKVGYKFEFQDKPQGKWDGRLWGEVIEVVEQKKLSYTWKGNQMKNNTLVTWLIEPAPEGTKLTLLHSGFNGLNDNIIGFLHKFGWKKYFNNLDEFLNKTS